MRTQKTIGAIALSLILIILLDHYVLPRRPVNDVITDKKRPYGYGKKRGPRYYIFTASGSRYPVSKKTFNGLVTGGPVTLYMTPIFYKKVTIAWCIDNDCRESSLEGFLDKYTGMLLLLVPYVLLLPGLLGLMNISSGRGQLAYYFGWVWAIFAVIIYFAS